MSEPVLTPEQDARVREIVDERLTVLIRHCRLCGVAPINRVRTCSEVDCPARIPEAA